MLSRLQSSGLVKLGKWFFFHAGSRTDKKLKIDNLTLYFSVMVSPKSLQFQYDVSGTYVYRPRGDKITFIYLSRRQQYGEKLYVEIPQYLVKLQTMLIVYDRRLNDLRDTVIG